MNRSWFVRPRVSVLAGIAALMLLGQHPADAATVVRRSIAALSPTGKEIASLRRGIQVMKSRPVTNPTSWLFQANMHGTHDAPANATQAAAWDQCQHGSFFFLSWHRMYLYYFERILRAASGDPSLTLPYWNYTDAAQRQLPLVFRSPANATSNPLYVAARAPGVNSGTARLPASAVNVSIALSNPLFFSPAGSGASFGGQLRTTAAHLTGPHGLLESTPHDTIHNLIGGSTGWMGDIALAARDPIFYLHHANIDRLWDVWLKSGGGRRNPTTNTAWMNTRFSFYDERGQRVQMTGAQIVDTVGQLGYRYGP